MRRAWIFPRADISPSVVDNKHKEIMLTAHRRRAHHAYHQASYPLSPSHPAHHPRTRRGPSLGSAYTHMSPSRARVVVLDSARAYPAPCKYRSSSSYSETSNCQYKSRSASRNGKAKKRTHPGECLCGKTSNGSVRIALDVLQLKRSGGGKMEGATRPGRTTADRAKPGGRRASTHPRAQLLANGGARKAHEAGLVLPERIQRRRRKYRAERHQPAKTKTLKVPIRSTQPPRPFSISLRESTCDVTRVKPSSTTQTLSMGNPSSTSTQAFGFEEVEPMYAGGGEHVHVRVQSKKDAGSARKVWRRWRPSVVRKRGGRLVVETSAHGCVLEQKARLQTNGIRSVLALANSKEYTTLYSNQTVGENGLTLRITFAAVHRAACF
ncbi:hypothetical protein DFH08DRAFT_817887 [Mycena albidolilacea]|uniref:Uncharacterized protein n=1 Tax=Mycena albidolilacea TaxID=1033008 RepID=A0AAD7EI20_9AGAR|nr:hypothetical protein DFH08DRAFT_817887 [Mycena albidolilacea]